MEMSGQFHTPTILPTGKRPPIPFGEGTGWASEPVWTWCQRQKDPAPVENRTPIIQPIV